MTEKQQKFFRARVALRFVEAYGRKPTEIELEKHVRAAQFYYPAFIPFFQRKSANHPQNLH